MIALLIILGLIAIVLLVWVFAAPSVVSRSARTPAVTQWFDKRDALPQSVMPQDQWYIQNWNNGWGPNAATYPRTDSNAPPIMTVARHYLGLPYRHHHIPGWNPTVALTDKPDEGPGLDCSNYTAWVYNYGRGIKFTSEIHQQAELASTTPPPGVSWVQIDPVYDPNRSPVLGPVLPTFQPGDLLYFWRSLSVEQSGRIGAREISHVALFSHYQNGVPYIIDSHGVGVAERSMGPNTWYARQFSHAVRITTTPV